MKLYTKLEAIILPIEVNSPIDSTEWDRNNNTGPHMAAPYYFAAMLRD